MPAMKAPRKMVRIPNPMRLAHRNFFFAGPFLPADEAVAATDDAGLVEAVGGSVQTVAGDERSLKVTRPLDLALAQLLTAEEPSA